MNLFEEYAEYKESVLKNIKNYGQKWLPEGWERTCELCGKRSSFSSVINLIYIDKGGHFLIDKYYYKKARTLLKTEISQLGEGEHWICRWRKDCKQRQWTQIRTP